MKKLKSQYDDLIKTKLLEEKPEMAKYFTNEEHRNYLNDYYLSKIKNELEPHIIKSFNDASGNEMKPENNLPPKFLSVASSSRFCIEGLGLNKVKKIENTHKGLYFFIEEGEHIIFYDVEKKAEIKAIRIDPEKKYCPHLDAYIETENMEYFFECKCHEMFDEHNIVLSSQYLKKDLIKSIDMDYIYHKTDKTKIEICKSAFKIEERLLFDVKQLLTHLLGIRDNKKGNAKLIYLYRFPCKPEKCKNETLKAYMKNTLDIAKKIFDSDIINNFAKNNNIQLELYYIHNSDIISDDNIVKCY